MRLTTTLCIAGLLVVGSLQWARPQAPAADKPTQAAASAASDQADAKARQTKKKTDAKATTPAKAGEAKDDQKKPDEAKPDQAKPDEKKDEAKAAEEVKPGKPQPFRITLGAAGYDVSGNFRKFRQYATPSRGILLEELRYQPESVDPRNNAFFTIKAPGQQDYLLAGAADLFYGYTQLRGDWRQNRFYQPTPTIEDPSDRKVQDGTIKQYLNRSFYLSVRYRMDEQNDFFETPHDPLRQRARYSDAVANGKLGPGRLSLSYSDWRYFDRTGTIKDSTIDRWQARYMWEPTQTIGLEALFSQSTISQPESPDSHVQTIGLAGDVQLGPATTMVLGYQQDNFNYPVVQSAWVREQRVAEGRIIQRWRGWTGMFGIRSKEDDRLRGQQNFVDVPNWLQFEGRINGRLNRNLRLTIRGFTEDMSRQPPMITDDPDPLTWSNRSFAQIKLDGMANTVGYYVIGSYNRRENAARSIGITNRSVTAGANWDATPGFSTFLEYTYDAWWANGGEPGQNQSLDLFAPNNTLIVAGFGWTITPNDYLWAAYTDFRTQNDNPLLLRDGNVRGRFLTLNFRHQLPRGAEVGLTIAPWNYRDRVLQTMDYSATVVMLTGSTRF
jgi:hypothetical protein